MTPKIVTLEGSDYSGKTSTLLHLAKYIRQKKNVSFNEGPVYPTGLTARLFVIANQSNDNEREFLYTMAFALDKVELMQSQGGDARTIFQDRYWPSVISYGMFLNRNSSIHLHQDFRPLFIQPYAVIVLSCSIDEKIRRSQQRERRSVIDNILLNNPGEVKRLESDIEKSITGLPNIFRIDTTNRSIGDVAAEIEGLGLHE